MKKTLLVLVSISTAISFLGANPPHANEKGLPPGLEKKVDKIGDLPPGWQKKIKVGEKIDYQVLRHGHEIHGKYNQFEDTIIYQVGSRIFRIEQDTREILEIIK